MRRASGMDQRLIQGPQEAGVDHRGGEPSLFQKRCCGQGWRNHRAVGHDHEIVAFPKQFTSADRQRFPPLFHQRHAFTGAPGNPQRRGPVVLQAGHQHPLQLSLILRRHHREVGDSPHVADVVLTLVGRAVCANDAGTIQARR